VKAARIQIDGVILLDKPIGLSSNDALMRAKRITSALKAGHGGTLDPLATGLLPLAFGEATKFLQGMLDASKTYLADVQFGVTTSTGDREGEILQTTEPQFNAFELEQAVLKFKGHSLQIPPMYSALKHDGVPLYKLAREGIEIEREARPINVTQLDIVAATESNAQLRVQCSKGTYIRTLAEDIGRELGCGAHLSALRRETLDTFTTQQAVTLDALEVLCKAGRLAEVLLPVDTMIQALPKQLLDDTLAARMMLGQRLRLPATNCQGRVRMYWNEHLLGVGVLNDGVLSPQRLVHSAATNSLYPKLDLNTHPNQRPVAQEALAH
jgi:tRNA pseudouridine55 synthase